MRDAVLTQEGVVVLRKEVQNKALVLLLLFVEGDIGADIVKNLHVATS